MSSRMEMIASRKEVKPSVSSILSLEVVTNKEGTLATTDKAPILKPERTSVKRP